MKKKLISLALIISLCAGIFTNIFLTQPAFVNADTAVKDKFSAKALYLMDYNTGEVLYESNKDERIPVASIVKLMTINLTCEELEAGRLSLDQLVVASANASSMGGSQVFIEEGGEYTVGDLLKSAIVSSANDASVALAECIAGSEDEFVVLMNKKAKELGLNNTNYVNCTGLPASNQFSCAEDTAKLLRAVTKHDDYHKYSTIWIDTLKHPKGRESELVNTNKLIRYYQGCDGGKTGSTNEAGYCLVATAKRGDMRLIGVVLGAENGKARFAETSNLLNYGFANFENKMVVDSSKPLTDEIKLSGGKQAILTARAKEDLFILSKKRDDGDEISTSTKVNKNLKAPIKKGDKVGEIYVVKNGEIIAQTDLVSMNNVQKSNLFDDFKNVVSNWEINK